MSQHLPWGVIWDLDGTLVDTAELHYQAWQALAKEIGKPFTRQDFAGTFGWRNPEIIPKLFGLDLDADTVNRLGDHKEDLYREEAKKGVPLLPGVRSLLDQIHDAGIPQAIGSSAPRRNIDLLLELTKTQALFDAIVSMEDTTRGKPDPAVFLLAAKRLGLQPARCIVIEDAPVGIQAARSGGMTAIGVTFTGQHSGATLEAAGARLVVANLEKLAVLDLQGIL
jgi:beta-phosphoglucomutase